VRYLLSRLDLLEESTLGDLSNLEGSLGRNSVFTVKDVQIKVEVSTKSLSLVTSLCRCFTGLFVSLPGAYG
jgi:hypothetical protein